LGRGLSIKQLACTSRETKLTRGSLGLKAVKM
jgi:hypothetical protein